MNAKARAKRNFKSSLCKNAESIYFKINPRLEIKKIVIFVERIISNNVALAFSYHISLNPLLHNILIYMT